MHYSIINYSPQSEHYIPTAFLKIAGNLYLYLIIKSNVRFWKIKFLCTSSLKEKPKLAQNIF